MMHHIDSQFCKVNAGLKYLTDKVNTLEKALCSNQEIEERIQKL